MGPNHYKAASDPGSAARLLAPGMWGCQKASPCLTKNNMAVVCCQNELTTLLVTRQPTTTDAQPFLLSESRGRSCISSLTWTKKVVVVVLLLHGYMSLLIQNANWFTWHLHNGLCWHWQSVGTRILCGRGRSHLSQGEKSLSLAWPRW